MIYLIIIYYITDRKTDVKIENIWFCYWHLLLLLLIILYFYVLFIFVVFIFELSTLC